MKKPALFLPLLLMASLALGAALHHASAQDGDREIPPAKAKQAKGKPLKWEVLAQEEPTCYLYRAPVPGGWLVRMSNGKEEGGLTFVPDPKGEWAAQIVPQDR